MKSNTKTVNITEHTKAILDEMSRQLGESVQTVLAIAVEYYQRKIMFEKANNAYAAAINENNESDQASRQEFELWERSTIADGLTDEHFNSEVESARSNI